MELRPSEEESRRQKPTQVEEETQPPTVESEQEEERNKKMRRSCCGWLRERKIREVVLGKRRLVEVPYTATLAHTVNALFANGVVAVPVAAPPGRWIGAGGSTILESDPATGAVRKHYIGMATMLDVLVHLAQEAEAEAEAERTEEWDADLDTWMSVPISSIIGNSLEGLSLWTLHPNTSILDCMEAFSKGVHRALVPVESQAHNAAAVELAEASPGYRMLTQMDVISFLSDHSPEMKDITSCSIRELGAINENVFAVTKFTQVIEAIKFMRSASLTAVPVVEAPGDGPILQDAKGKKLVETFSSTDLRGCPIARLRPWLSISVIEFKEKVRQSSRNAPPNAVNEASSQEERKLVTCLPEASLAEVIEKAVANHVHRVWVVDHDKGQLIGLVSLTDILQTIRKSALMLDRDLGGDIGPKESSR